MERSPRWENYFMCQNEEVIKFWSSYINLSIRNILFIIGLGFDPRMCIGFEKIVKIDGDGKRDLMLINFDEGEYSPSQDYKELVEKNNEKIRALMPTNGVIIEKTIKMVEESRRISDIEAANVIDSLDILNKYTDVIVDISSLPRGIYFPLIGKILSLIDYSHSTINLHIIVAENFIIDKSIKERGIAEDAEYIHGFKGNIESAVYRNNPKIWLPILGENQLSQMEKIGIKVNANEIFPLLPLPSMDPRRADDLIYEYREFLFDRLNIDPRNILYVAEKNPFEVYRRLYRTIKHFQEALNTLGECPITISASSSKLLSIGALLVAYELKDTLVGVINVETFGYDPSEITPKEIKTTELFSLWIAGDCYNNQ